MTDRTTTYFGDLQTNGNTLIKQNFTVGGESYFSSNIVKIGTQSIGSATANWSTVWANTLNVSVMNTVTLASGMSVGTLAPSFGSAAGVSGNIYTTSDIAATNVLVTTANLTGTTMNVQSLSAPIRIGTATAGASVGVPGNVWTFSGIGATNVLVTTANLTGTTMNVQSLSAPIRIGTVTAGATLGSPGNVFASNAMSATNVLSTSANISFVNVNSLQVLSNIGIGTTPVIGGPRIYTTQNIWSANALSTTNVVSLTNLNVTSMNVLSFPSILVGINGPSDGVTNLYVTGSISTRDLITALGNTQANMSLLSINVGSVTTNSNVVIAASPQGLLNVGSNLWAANAIQTTNLTAILSNTQTANVSSVIALPNNVGIGTAAPAFTSPTIGPYLVGSASLLYGSVAGGLTAVSFPNSSSYLNFGTNAAIFDLNSSNIFCEAWVYLTSYVNAGIIAASSASLPGTSSTFGFTIGNGAGNALMVIRAGNQSGGYAINSSSGVTAPVLNQWQHVAWFIGGGKYNWWANGISDYSPGGSYTDPIYTNAGQPFCIGVNNYSIPGYVRDLRIIKGGIMPTSGFTPDTAPFSGAPSYVTGGTTVFSLASQYFGSTPSLTIAPSLNYGTSVTNVIATQTFYATTSNITTANVTNLPNSVGILTAPTGNTLEVLGNVYTANTIFTTNVRATTITTSNANAVSYAASSSLGFSLNTAVLNTLSITGLTQQVLVGTTGLQPYFAIAGSLSVSNLDSSFFNSSTPIMYNEDSTKRSIHLVPSASNATTIQSWISAQCNAASQPVSYWSTTSQPVFANVVSTGTPTDAFKGSVLLPDGRVVFVPYNVSNVGVYNPVTRQYSNVTPTGDAIAGSTSYYSGVLLPSGNVFFCPYSSANVGIYNPVMSSFSNVGLKPCPITTAYTGASFGPFGNVYLFPFTSAVDSNILTYNEQTLTTSNISGVGFSSGLQINSSVLTPTGNIFVTSLNSQIGQYNILNRLYSLDVATGPTWGSAQPNHILTKEGQVLFTSDQSNLVMYNQTNKVFSNIVTGIAAGYMLTCGILLPTGNIMAFYQTAAQNVIMVNTSTLVSSNIYRTGSVFNGATLHPSGQVVLCPGTGSNVGVISGLTPVSRDLCLSPYFNKL